MGIDSESDIEAELQIGPTSLGMVRIFISRAGAEIPMDFDPDEAEEIADELRAAARQARSVTSGGGTPGQRGGSRRNRTPERR